jgi:chondroitin 4-sulfotransferase 11
MLISHDYKFIFIHIGKTGGTSIERALCSFLRIDFEATEISPDGKWWKHKWAAVMREILGKDLWDDYFTFAFVRNPYDMILSLYCMYTQYPEYTNPKQHSDLYHPWNQYSCFTDFIRCMGQKSHQPDDIWQHQLEEIGVTTQMNIWNDIENLQTSYLTESWKGRDGMGSILVDYVGRFENLDEDFHFVCDHLGLPRLELPSMGTTKHEYFSELYDDKAEAIVSEHFKMDLDRFGYTMSPADTMDTKSKISESSNNRRIIYG